MDNKTCPSDNHSHQGPLTTSYFQKGKFTFTGIHKKILLHIKTPHFQIFMNCLPKYLLRKVHVLCCIDKMHEAIPGHAIV